MKKLRKKLQVENINETVKLDKLKRCLIRAAEDDSFSYDGDEAVRSVENFYSIRIVEKGNQPRLSNINGFDKAFETYDWVYLIEGEKAERGSGESELSFWSATEALEKNYKVLAHGWEDRMTNYWIVVDKEEDIIMEADEEESEPIEVKENPDSDYAQKLIDFGTKILQFGVVAHIWHLNVKSNAQHLALKELYDACDDLGDKLLEAALGTTDANIDNAEYDFTGLDFDDSCIGKIRDMENEAKSLIDSCDDAGIENILADFCEVCNSVVYKLRRLK